MMKQNSKKSLFLLYSPDHNRKILGSVEAIFATLPDMTAGGRRAMLTWWIKKGWVESVNVENNRFLALTSLGKAVLEAELPYFQVPANWAGEWQLLIFRQAPDEDQAFHRLSHLIKRYHPLVISRGVYAFVGAVPVAIKQVCAGQYSQSVLIITAASHSSSQLADLAITYYHLYDLLNLYSGVSSQSIRLLIENSLQKGLNYRQKRQYYSLYDRFFALFCEDNGLLEKLLPNSPHTLTILAKLQSLILT